MNAGPQQDGPRLIARRRAATQVEIATAAATLFLSQGFEATTVEQIATTAGVSLRTFYRYCAAKDDAMTAVLSDGVVDLVALIEAAPAADPLDVVVARAFVQSVKHGEAAQIRRELTVVMLSIPVLRMRWLDAGRNAQDALVPVLAHRLDIPRDGLEVRTLATLIVGALTTALEYSVSADLPLDECVQNSLATLDRGLLKNQ